MKNLRLYSKKWMVRITKQTKVMDSQAVIKMSATSKRSVNTWKRLDELSKKCRVIEVLEVHNRSKERQKGRRSRYFRRNAANAQKEKTAKFLTILIRVCAVLENLRKEAETNIGLRWVSLQKWRSSEDWRFFKQEFRKRIDSDNWMYGWIKLGIERWRELHYSERRTRDGTMFWEFFKTSTKW